VFQLAPPELYEVLYAPPATCSQPKPIVASQLPQSFSLFSVMPKRHREYTHCWLKPEALQFGMFE
jgi:hypothetical protein